MARKDIVQDPKKEAKKLGLKYPSLAKHKALGKAKEKDYLGKVEMWKDKHGYHAYSKKHDVYDQFATAEDRKWRTNLWKKEAKQWAKYPPKKII